jgi:hypothetical protein
MISSVVDRGQQFGRRSDQERRRPDRATAAYLHNAFALTAQANDGSERSLAALGLCRRCTVVGSAASIDATPPDAPPRT